MGAAVGVLVAVFQWEWVAGVVGVTRQGPVEAFLPVFVLPPSFRLSMDYEVFLLTRIHEEYLRTGDNSGSVRLGLSTAVLLDAVIVGSALMQMSGKANWWFPGWLDRMLPHLHVESEDADAELVEATEGEAVGVSQPRQNPGLRVFAPFLSVPVATLFPTSRSPCTAHGAVTSGPRAPGLWPFLVGADVAGVNEDSLSLVGVE